MFALHLFLFVCFVAYGAYGEVTLKENVNQTVTFDGDDLSIVIDNSLGKEGDLMLCLGSASGKSSPPCPAGFARAPVVVYGNEKLQVTVNRQGQVIQSGTILRLYGAVKFINDGVLNIMVAKMSDSKTTVTLPNAEIYVPDVPTEEPTTVVNKDSNAATIGIIVGVVGLILLILAIVVTVGVCLYRRRKNKKQAIAPPEIVVQKVPHPTETADPSPGANIKKEKQPTPQTPTATTDAKAPPTKPPTPKPVSAEKPKPPTATPAPSAESAAPPPASPSTEPVEQVPSKEPVKKSKGKKAGTPKAAQSAEQSKEATDDQSAKQKSKGDSKASLKVQKTQNDVTPSPPTAPFSEGSASKLTSRNSAFKEVDDIPYTQTANPYYKKVNYKKLDEFAKYKYFSENIRCHGLRNGKFNEHDNYIIKLHFKVRPHTVSRDEKAILKGTPAEAVDAADLLVARIEREMAELGFEDNGEFDQNDRLWKHLNDESTETSKLYWMMLKLRPALFKVKYQTLKDDAVQIMPVAMLYTMVLNTKLERRFREELVHELRRLTVEVIRMAGKNKLRLSAFPMHYLVLLYAKNPKAYVDGRSCRSVTSAKHR